MNQERDHWAKLTEESVAALAEALRHCGYEVRHAPDAHSTEGSALDPSPLTRRQVAVLRALWRCETLKETADFLGISVETVKTHLEHVCQRLHVHGRMAALRWAAGRGLLDAE